MPQQKLSQTELFDQKTLRTRQYENIELLASTSEFEYSCISWLVDLWGNADFETGDPVS